MNKLKTFFRDLRALGKIAVCTFRGSHRDLRNIGHLTRAKGGFAPVPLAQCMKCGSIIMNATTKPKGTREL